MSEHDRYIKAAKIAFNKRVAYWAPEQFHDKDCQDVLIEDIVEAVLDEIHAPPVMEKENDR